MVKGLETVVTHEAASEAASLVSRLNIVRPCLFESLGTRLMRRPVHLEHFIVDRVQSLLLHTCLHLGTAAPVWQEVGLDIGIRIPLPAACH